MDRKYEVDAKNVKAVQIKLTFATALVARLLLVQQCEFSL